MTAINEYELLSSEEQLLVNEIETLTARLMTYNENLLEVRNKLEGIRPTAHVNEG